MRRALEPPPTSPGRVIFLQARLVNVRFVPRGTEAAAPRPTAAMCQFVI